MSEKIEWTDELTLDLIEAYRKEELLWNPSNNLYHNNNKKKDAWKRLGELFGCKEGDTKKKIDSLLTSFRRERQKCKPHSGDGVEDVYISNWFAFKHMQFLMDKFTPRKTIDNVSSATHGSPDDVEDINLNDSQNENTTAQDNENTAEQGHKSQRDMQPKNKTKSNRKRQREEDPRIEEAYSILKDSLAKKTRDESTVFGEHVANKHRKYNSQIRSIIEHKINDILFQADMGYLSHSYYHQASQSQHGSTSSYGSIYIQPSTSSSQPQSFHAVTTPNSTPFQTPSPLPSPHLMSFPQPETFHTLNTRNSTSYQTPTPLPSPQNEDITTQYEYEQPTKNIMQFVTEFTGE